MSRSLLSLEPSELDVVAPLLRPHGALEAQRAKRGRHRRAQGAPHGSEAEPFKPSLGLSRRLSFHFISFHFISFHFAKTLFLSKAFVGPEFKAPLQRRLRDQRTCLQSRGAAQSSRPRSCADQSISSLTTKKTKIVIITMKISNKQ